MDRGDRNRPDRIPRGGPSGRSGGAMDRPARPDRPLDRNKRMESGGPGRMEPRAGGGNDRMDRGSRDRSERDRSSGAAPGPRGSHRAGYGSGSGGGGDSSSRSKGDSHRSSHNSSHNSESARSGSRGRRASEFSSNAR